MKELDTSGFNCPIPIIKAKKELNGMETGETLKLISTDQVQFQTYNRFAIH